MGFVEFQEDCFEDAFEGGWVVFFGVVAFQSSQEMGQIKDVFGLYFQFLVLEDDCYEFQSLAVPFQIGPVIQIFLDHPFQSTVAIAAIFIHLFDDLSAILINFTQFGTVELVELF